MRSVLNITTTCAIWVQKRVRNFGFFGELVFHPPFEGLPVVARPSGENFPSPFNQFQSIGPKKFEIPTPLLTYVCNLQFVILLRQLNESVTFCPLENLTVLK